MVYELEQLAADIRAALAAEPGTAGRQAACRFVEKALADDAFVAAHLKDRAPGALPRELLFEDPELGFCICGHVYGDAAHSQPHDHGATWAIYGQARGRTEMTDWRIVEAGEGDQPALVEPVESYALEPGQARLYDVGTVHSPRRAQPTKLIRIEGQNLDTLQRSNIKAK
jgi:predicted metal-dependent enzyme (double-stranded beta helix superfamily)